MSVERYIHEKLRPITLSKDKVKDEDRRLDENEVTLVRGAGGSLLWVGREARPDVGAACPMSMTWSKEGPTVRNIKHCNKVIRELKKTADVYLRIQPIALEDGIWLVFSDASLANDGEKSQGGFLVVFAERAIARGAVGKISMNS